MTDREPVEPAEEADVQNLQRKPRQHGRTRLVSMWPLHGDAKRADKLEAVNAERKTMTGYKNAPHIKPQVGDVVKYENLPDEIRVTSIGKLPPETDEINVHFFNCSFQNTNMPDRFHLNQPETMILVRTVDGINPAQAQTTEAL